MIRNRTAVLATALVLVVVAFALAAAAAQPAKAADAQHAYALMMGSTYFPNGGGSYGPIPADKDVEVWRHLLVDQLGWSPDHVTIQMDEQFTKANILAQIRALKQHDSKDSVFFIYMATHGWTVSDAGSPIEGDEDAYYSGSRQGHDPWDELLFTFDSDAHTDANIIYDDEFKLLFDELDFKGQVVFVSCTCCGGGLVEDIARPGLLALAVCNSDRNEMHWWEVHNLPAYALGGCTYVPSYIDVITHPELMFPDANGDGKVSVEESFAWAVGAQAAAAKSYIAHGGGTAAQYMYDGIEGETFLSLQ
jgi:hypothetical protein